MNTLFLAAEYTGTSFLSEAVKTSVTNGMLDMQATVSDVLLVSIPIIVAVIGLTVGANFAISKIRSIASWAS